MNPIKVIAKRTRDWAEKDAIWLGHDRYRCPFCLKGYFRVVKPGIEEPQKCPNTACESIFDSWIKDE